MINRDSIKGEIKQLLIDMRSQDDLDAALEFYSDALSRIISEAILSAEVNVGIGVSTTGSATAQTGFTTTKGRLS